MWREGRKQMENEVVMGEVLKKVRKVRKGKNEGMKWRLLV
jgi:hypothetical protein